MEDLERLETKTEISDYSQERPASGAEDASTGKPVVRSKKEAAMSQKKMLILFTAVVIWLFVCFALNATGMFSDLVIFLLQAPVYAGVLIAFLVHKSRQNR